MIPKQRWELRAYRERDCRVGWTVRGRRAFAYARAAAHLASDKFDDLSDGWTRVEVLAIDDNGNRKYDGTVRVTTDHSPRFV